MRKLVWTSGRTLQRSCLAAPPRLLGVNLTQPCRTFSGVHRLWQELQVDKKPLSSAPTDEQTQAVRCFSDDEFLARCLPYGISSITQLRDQSHPDPRAKPGTYLVDKEPYRSDLILWKLLLDYSVQHSGIVGVRAIMHALKYRASQVQIPYEDEVSTAIWEKMLSMAVANGHMGLVKCMCHPNGIFWNRPKLFPEAVAIALRLGQERDAISIASWLVKRKHDSVTDSKELFRLYRPRNTDEIHKFCRVYERLKLKNLYDSATQQLWDENFALEAFALHKFLIAREDVPSSAVAIRPFLAHLARENEHPSLFLHQLARCGASFSMEALSVYDAEKHQPGASLMLSRSYSVSDSFAAKAFATKGLPFEFILGSLRAFGLTQIGPQSIREIGLRARSTKVFRQHLASLEEAGIDTGGSAYSRFVRTLCNAGEDFLLRQALQTDMHHDVFEDEALQVRLLHDHFHRGAWKEVNLLVAMLNGGRRSPLSSQLKNHLLNAASTGNPRTLLGMLLQTQQTSFGLDTGSTAHLTGSLLRQAAQTSQHACQEDKTSSRPSKRPSILYTLGVTQDAVAAGFPIGLGYWKGILLRLAATGAFEDLTNLCYWIPRMIQNHREVGDQLTQAPSTTLPVVAACGIIFDYRFQRRLMQWSLRRSLRTRTPAERDRWKKSLQLLQFLRDEHQVRIYPRAVQDSIVEQCRYFMPQLRLGNAGPYYMQACRFLCEALGYMHRMFGITRSDIYTQKGMKFLLSQRRIRTRKTSLISGKTRPLVSRWFLARLSPHSLRRSIRSTRRTELYQ